MIKVAREIGFNREISKNNEAIVHRDPKHPYNPVHKLKNQDNLQKCPIAKIFERWPRFPHSGKPGSPPDPLPETPCFGSQTLPRNFSKNNNLVDEKFGVVLATTKSNKCDKCGKEYKYASGLSRHKKQCGGVSLSTKNSEIRILKQIIESSDNLPSITDLFFELAERSHQQIMELKNENKKLKYGIESSPVLETKNTINVKLRGIVDVDKRNLKLDTINLRKINAVCNKKIQDLTDENEKMREYNENVVLPGVKQFQEFTKQKISYLEAEIERLKAKIKAYES